MQQHSADRETNIVRGIKPGARDYARFDELGDPVSLFALPICGHSLQLNIVRIGSHDDAIPPLVATREMANSAAASAYSWIAKDDGSQIRAGSTGPAKA